MAHAPLPDDVDTVPNSWGDFLDRAAALADRGIHVTADPKVVLELEAVDTIRRAVARAWNALLALADYRRATQEGATDKDVAYYLEHTPAGYRGFPPGKHGRSETNATMSAFGDERCLPVPISVDASGEIVMTSHFKLAHIGTVSPRMYYYNDLAGTGDLYVGYIGKHMQNTQTANA